MSTGVLASEGTGAPAGSTFNEVRNVVFKEDVDLVPESFEEAQEIASYQLGVLPHISVTWHKFKYASDTTKNVTSLDGWQRLGTIRLKESIVSYGCDRRLHFHHNKIGE